MSADFARCCIVSGSSEVRLRSHLNHKTYATVHGHDYRFETGPFPGMQSRYFLKIHALEHLMPRYDWLLWVDDDAFFTDFATEALDRIVAGAPEDTFLFACRSPVNEHGKWTFLNSGVLLLRSGDLARRFLAQVRVTPLEAVRASWDEQRYGMFTDGDQDVVIHLLHTLELLDRIRLSDCEVFNARPRHYRQALDEHLICHFAGTSDKLRSIRTLAERFGVDDTLVPAEVARRHGLAVPPARQSTSGRRLHPPAVAVAAWHALRRRLQPGRAPVGLTRPW